MQNVHNTNASNKCLGLGSFSEGSKKYDPRETRKSKSNLSPASSLDPSLREWNRPVGERYAHQKTSFPCIMIGRHVGWRNPVIRCTRLVTTVRGEQKTKQEREREEELLILFSPSRLSSSDPVSWDIITFSKLVAELTTHLRFLLSIFRLIVLSICRFINGFGVRRFWPAIVPVIDLSVYRSIDLRFINGSVFLFAFIALRRTH